MAGLSATAGGRRPVGLVGLGIMGSALAQHLIARGHEVVGYDVSEDRMAEHAQRGGSGAGAAREVGARCSLTITSLPSDEALLAALTGPAGLLATAAERHVVVETSTLSPEVKRAARATCAARGVYLLDCPLSGTGAQAREGDLVAFLSGDDRDAKAVATSVLTGVVRRVVDVGAFGNGTAVKLIANLLVAVHNAAAAEAVLLAERAGLDPRLVIDAVADGAGGSRMLRARGPLMAERRFRPATATLRTMAKDLELIEAFARGQHSPTPLLDVTSTLYRATSSLEPDDLDSAAVFATLLRLCPPPDDAGSATDHARR
ncbi:NAD(P)-dependent oxidoreductase [Rhizomonospora bruguierae]|uniref:NAD(P)-dependent oxidoreductase n=1 Tax=Rhizomonospora bruguierae TaxID=1581705 RepID=UPI001BCD0B54|nr:NAD(P)-dependent oxidoreductase [Micromonospora sp. NBRC 107566]